MIGKTAVPSTGGGSRTVANAKKSAGRVKTSSKPRNAAPVKSYSKSKPSGKVPSTVNIGTPGPGKGNAAVPAPAPVLPAGMPHTIAVAAAQKAAALKAALALQTKAKVGAPIVKKTGTPIAPVAAPSAYRKSLPVAAPSAYRKSLPTSGSSSVPTGASRPAGGGSGGGGGSTTPVAVTPSTPVVTPPTTVAPGVVTPTTTAHGATQSGGFNTKGARTYGQFDRRRQTRGPRTGLSMTPEMLQRLAGQRITNPR